MQRLSHIAKEPSRAIHRTTNRRRIILIILVTLLGCSCALYLGYTTTSNSQSFDYQREFQIHNKLPEVTPHGGKTILYWNGLFEVSDFNLSEGHVSQHCPSGYNNCYATSDRNSNSIDSYDIILFHGINDELNENDLPSKRSPDQKYIFVALESPANRYISSRFDSFFNATATYQSDSDILWTYSDVVQIASNGTEGVRDNQIKIEKLVKKKSRVAAWYVSNCNTKSKREKFVTELEKYMPVNKFGRCFEWLASCPRNRDCFHDEIEPNYFFYLAFENSLCEDYVTEKFFNTLKYYVVPVVYGGANYTKIAPPKSFIDAKDFKSPQHLALYLQKLTKNFTDYAEYFKWKGHYQIVSPEKRIICDLCKLANDNKKKTYNISKWYSSSRCRLKLN
ncbi:hypothetical protein QAD02_017749 [Eretmocerus hayati]|uniref:Uncharacterized protein n=1 Tax=Eretmocerus hayati TaxID=131215 RepID=A0ACC2PHR0_9HYME|nr:hypothetical protein QAD02_017749 [Eretmocerus hayati]